MLKQINKERETIYEKKMIAYDNEATATSNSASRPRLVEKVQEYKCPCEDISGIYCPECEGDDPDCEICACDCNTGPHKLSDFGEVSRKRQAFDLGLIDEDGVKTVHDNRESFLDMIHSSLVVRIA